LARDAMVLAADSSVDRRGYGEMLLRLVERRLTFAAAPHAVGVFGAGASLKDRISMIAAFNRNRRRSLVGPLIFLIVSCVGLSDGSKDQRPPTTAPSPASQPVGVPDLIRSAKESVRQRRYAEAMETIDRILVLEPNNDYARGARPPVQDKANLQAEREWRDSKPGAAAALDKLLPEVKFDAVAFREVINFLRDVTKANIWVNWRALEAAGIDSGAPVSAGLRDVKFSEGLTIILREISTPKTTVRYVLDEGVITITTEDELNKSGVTRVYDVRDLTSEAPGRKWFGMEAAAEEQERVRKLMALMRETVAPTSWDKVRETQYIGGQLVITQTKENQQEVRRFLDQLREAGRDLENARHRNQTLARESPLTASDASNWAIFLLTRQGGGAQ
jgi:hypothetical protein